MVTNQFSLISAFLLSFAIAQQIELKDFSYKDNTTTCSNVLISDYDVVEFTCLVEYSQDPDVKYVIFQTKKTSQENFIFLTDCNIKEDCKHSQNARGSHIGKYVIDITIRVNATSSLNGAKLRGLLYLSDHKAILSGEKTFPHITDLPEAEGKLIVNGKTITPPTECHEVITRPELNIVFLCESQGLPCLIEISTDESNETSQGVGHATWNKEYPSQSEVSVLIKYALCNLSGNSKSVSCKLNIEYKSTTSENGIVNHAIRAAISLPIVMILITIPVCLCLLKNKYTPKVFRICLNRNSAGHGPLNSPVTSKHTDINAVTLRLLNDASPLGGAILRENCIDDERGTHSNIKNARKRQITTIESCTALEPRNLEHYLYCQKKESHKYFIQMNKFSKAHLPQIYQETDLKALITIIACLTVKITVTFISHQRTDCYPETDHQYPFSDKKGDTVIIRNGTGLIRRVKIIKESGAKCTCHKCRHSEEAAKVWAKIYISTTKSLLFHDSEDRKSTFKICFNGETGPYHCLDGFSVKQSDINDDQGEVECVTCDTNLITSLRTSLKICRQKMANVNYIYKTNKFDDNLTIIVSHPHGCPKQVSMGKWTNRVILGTDGSIQKTKYTYTAPTCPGCIGAFVYLVGISDVSLTHHLHCGVNDEMHNFSSTGWEPINEKT